MLESLGRVEISCFRSIGSWRSCKRKGPLIVTATRGPNHPTWEPEW